MYREGVYPKRISTFRPDSPIAQGVRRARRLSLSLPESPSRLFEGTPKFEGEDLRSSGSTIRPIDDVAPRSGTLQECVV